VVRFGDKHFSVGQSHLLQPSNKNAGRSFETARHLILSADLLTECREGNQAFLTGSGHIAVTRPKAMLPGRESR